MDSKQGIVVCGMHGKTTTSAMTAHVLRAGGFKPSHYVGAEIPILGTNARWDSEGEWFVAEGDESDGTLINYHPRHAIVLNIGARAPRFLQGSRGHRRRLQPAHQPNQREGFLLCG
jgi:UDP-N-acetylmuramate-alanine ligase